MITCRELVELLADLVSDQLPAERRDHVELHLSQCPSCLAYLESYRTLVAVSRRLPVAPLPARLEQRLRKLLRENCKGQEPARDEMGRPPEPPGP
jgi:anti-sigma factor RsiW